MEKSKDEAIKDEILNSAPSEPSVIASGPAPEKKPGFFKTKNGKILLIVLGALVVFGAGVGATLLLTNMSNNSETVANKESEDGKEEAQKKQSGKETEGKKVNESSEESESAEKTEIKPIDLSKPINGSGMEYTNISDGSSSAGGWTVAVNSDKTGASLTGDGTILRNYVFDWTGPGGTWAVTGFSGKIKQAIIGVFGQTAFSAPLPAIYLMEDGTVEYSPILKWVSGPQGKVIEIQDEFKSQKISGIGGVVKLYEAEASPSGTAVGGGGTILAAKADGSFYDLAQSLGLYDN